MPTQQDPRCPYCGAVVYPEEYVGHLETHHPQEAKARSDWIALFKDKANELERTMFEQRIAKEKENNV